jgi:hypothetical protein
MKNKGFNSPSFVWEVMCTLRVGRGSFNKLPKLLITFFAGRRRSERIPFQTGQARADGITRDAEARITCEVAELIGSGVAGGARKRADASVGWLG